MTAQEQMSEDIKRWSAEKLVQWMSDSVMRYRLIGLSKKDAEVEVMAILVATTAGMLATHTDASVFDICTKLGTTIASIRHEEGIELNLGVDNNDNL
jgi:pyrroline-5-carboxylate reductase